MKRAVLAIVRNVGEVVVLGLESLGEVGEVVGVKMNSGNILSRLLGQDRGDDDGWPVAIRVLNLRNRSGGIVSTCLVASTS